MRFIWASKLSSVASSKDDSNNGETILLPPVEPEDPDEVVAGEDPELAAAFEMDVADAFNSDDVFN